MEKHRLAVDFQFQNGAFRPLTATDPLQLYRVFECELSCSSKETVCVPEGAKLLVLCVAGSGVLSTESEEATLKFEDIAVCNNGNYEISVCSGCDQSVFLCLIFDSSLQQTMYTSLELSYLSEYFQTMNGMVVSEGATEVYRCFQELVSELSLPEPTKLLVKGLFYQLMTEVYRQLVRHTYNQGVDGVEMHAVGQTVYAIVRYIEEHLFSIDNLMDMAKELGYSYNYLSHLFRRKTGMTIQSYVTQKKIEQSTKLLADEQYSITEIATMLNYDCIQSFSKAFRRAMGVSPTQYRSNINR